MKWEKKYKKGGKLKGKSHEDGGIIIEAEDGEFVINKEVAKRLGYKNLEELNETGEWPVFDARKRGK